jgi:curved DNA-binding protein CbpA
MKGKLTEQPLAELIREISSQGSSGTLRLERERAQTAVYFDSGQLVYAASNVRTLRLREYVSKRGIVADKDRAILGNNLSDLALAAALSARGTLRQTDVDGLLATLVADVLRVALLWTEGTWEFDDRARLDDPVRIQVNTANLLREAAQRMPLKFVSDRFRNPDETISRSSEFPLTSNFLPAESFVLSRLDQPTRLEDLIALSGLRELDAYRVIYGLALSGLVIREYWQNAFRTERAKTKEQPGARVAAETQASDAGLTDSRWTAISDEEEDLEKFLLRLSQAANYYEVMELPTTAGANEIKEAYYALARRYHPDRFHLQFGTQLHAKLSSAFARITQAYERLTDAKARSAYDKAMERSRRLAESTLKPAKVESWVDSADDLKFKTGDSGTDAGRAENNFREGIGAQKEGRIDAAISYLAAAARLAPQEARYRAYYGRALAASDKTRRLAESEMQAAVQLDPASANIRTMLAELYFDLKFHRRAEAEVERALALDPNNAPAQSLLRKLEKSRKVG